MTHVKIEIVAKFIGWITHMVSKNYVLMLDIWNNNETE